MTDDDNQFYIPRRLNDPAKFLFWDWDVFLIYFGIFSLGIILGQLLLMAIVAIYPAYLYSRTKTGRHPGYSGHFTYWYLGVPRLKATPPSHIRELIG